MARRGRRRALSALPALLLVLACAQPQPVASECISAARKAIMWRTFSQYGHPRLVTWRARCSELVGTWCCLVSSVRPFPYQTPTRAAHPPLRACGYADAPRPPTPNHLTGGWLGIRKCPARWWRSGKRCSPKSCSARGTRRWGNCQGSPSSLLAPLSMRAASARSVWPSSLRPPLPARRHRRRRRHRQCAPTR